ncbi:transcription factor grauzone-like [Uranotaenia lowii]|uniref:transcription factor grauzone-like n=1 Tax=Uranotaenia lowii TaxID=190385 RepID=UPI00247B26C1|nr:transcription factor grauzone-like [Uranotaenia lowii]
MKFDVEDLDLIPTLLVKVEPAADEEINNHVVEDDFPNSSDDEMLAKKMKTENDSPPSTAKRKYSRKKPLKEKGKAKRKKKPLDRARENRRKSKSEILEEDRKISEYFKFVCELCQQQSGTFRDLKQHYRDVHDQRGYQRCCNRKLFRRCRLLEHIEVHLNPNHFGCDVCSKSFSSMSYLRLHKKEVHEVAVNRPFKCDQCPKTFVQKGQLSSHLSRHKMHQCSICDKFLTGKGSLLVHMAKMHSEEGRMICDTCGKEFKFKPSFDRHVRMHLGIAEDTSVECEICGDILATKVTLKHHMIAKHSESTEQHICNVCGRSAPNKLALDSHKRKIHREEKYQCEFCEKRFKCPVALKEHRASHTGEVLYNCSFCASTFNSKANMYSHRKKAHPVEWAQERTKKQMGS